MHFTVLDALCPVTGKIGRAIFDGATQPATGFAVDSEANPTQPMPRSIIVIQSLTCQGKLIRRWGLSRREMIKLHHLQGQPDV